MTTKTYFRGPMAIFFHTIDVDPHLKHKNALKRWISACAIGEKRTVGTINIIFCSDDYLLDMNRQHLAHDYYTDIITFDFSVNEQISGDLYISFDRVKDNALKTATPLNFETYRVIIHGVMHLCGYKDKSKSDALTMRQKEDSALLKIQQYLEI